MIVHFIMSSESFGYMPKMTFSKLGGVLLVAASDFVLKVVCFGLPYYYHNQTSRSTQVAGSHGLATCCAGAKVHITNWKVIKNLAVVASG